MADRLSSLDAGYVTGELSVYPLAIDSRQTLYEARNNACTTLKQSLTINGTTIIVADATSFPPTGLIRVGPPIGVAGNYEFMYYGSRTNSTLTGIVRGFGGSRQGQWAAGSTVLNAVMSDYHNALKDAIIQIETNLGLSGLGTDSTGALVAPLGTSLNGILDSLETRFLAPKPIFQAYPLSGTPGVQVRFQNFSGGDPIRYLWSFGDGTTSTDHSPIHTYINDGFYTVELSVITGLGAMGIATKLNYIKISADNTIPFYYVNQGAGTSIATAGSSATTFEFVDQTDGPIVERIWNFDDGTRTTIDDPNNHTVTHQYQNAGSYQPTLLVILEDQTLKRADLPEPIQVS